MKPVEIEFLMRDRLTPGMESGRQAAERLFAAVHRVERGLYDTEGAAQNAGKFIGKALESAHPKESFRRSLDALWGSLDTYAKECEEASRAETKFLKNGDAEGAAEKRSEIEGLEATLTELAAVYGLVEKASDEYNAKSQEVQESTEQLANAETKHESTLVRLMGGQRNYNAILGALPPEIRSAITGIEGMTRASLAFIATPLGMVLAAVATALALLNSYWHGTVEGEEEFVRVSGYAEGVMRSLKDECIDMGRTLAHLFDDPKRKVVEFWEGVKQNFKDGFTSVGKTAKSFAGIISSALMGDMEGVKKSYDELIVGLKGMGKSATYMADKAGLWWSPGNLKNGYDKLKNWNTKAGTDADLAAQTQEIEQERIGLLYEEAKIDRELIALRNKMYSGDAAQRLKAQAEAQELVNKKYDKQIELAERELDIAEKSYANHHSTIADTRALEEARARVEQLKGQKESAMLPFNRRGAAAENSLEKAAALSSKVEGNLSYLDARQQAQAERESRRLALQTAQAYLDGMDEGHEKILARLDLQKQQELLAIEEQKENALMAKIAQAKQVFDADKGNAGKVFDMGSVNFTDEELRQWDDLTAAVKAKIKKMESDVAQEAERSWEDYLIAYGDFEEKRAALKAQYGRQIAGADSEGKRLSLEKELEERLKGLDFDAFKESIDFAEVFGSLDTQSTAALSVLREKLAKYIEGAAKDLRPEDLKALREALTKIDLKVSERSPFSELKRDMKAYGDALKLVRAAESDLEKVRSGGAVTVEEYDEETGEVVKRLLSEEDAEKRLSKAQSQRFKALGEATQSLHEGVEKMKEYVAAAESVVGLLTELGVELPSEIGEITGGFGEMLDGLASIDLTNPASVITGGAEALKGAVKAMEGVADLFGADIGGKKSVQRYEEAKAMYERYMAVLDRVKEKQLELVSSMSGADYQNADNSYEYAKSLIAKSDEAARNLGRNYLNSGASNGVLGIGSHASKGTEQRENMSDAGWDEYNALKGMTDKLAELGFTVGSLEEAAGGRMTGLFDLTAAQLEWIMENAPTFWAGLHDDTRQYLEEIIACGDELEKVEAARDESLTKMTFDDFYSSWLEKILDMKSDVADVAEMMEEDFQKAILTSLMEEKYKGELEKLYKMWADKTESGGKLDELELEALREENDRIAEEFIRERDALAEAFGWSVGDEDGVTQSGKAGAFTSMSQEQGTKLEGLFVSGQMHWSSMDEQLEEVSVKMGEAADTLARIEANTGSSASTLVEIKEDLKKVIRDGLKVK